jgi:hypothetical protein
MAGDEGVSFGGYTMDNAMPRSESASWEDKD